MRPAANIRSILFNYHINYEISIRESVSKMNFVHAILFESIVRKIRTSTRCHQYAVVIDVCYCAKQRDEKART